MELAENRNQEIMNYKTSMEHILTVINQLAKNYYDIDIVMDEISPDLEISIFDGQPCLRLNSIPETNFSITPTATRQLLQKLGIPSPYLGRCSLELQLHNLFEWIEYHKIKKIRVRIDGQKIRAVLSQRFSTECDNIHLLPAIFNAVKSLANAYPDTHQPSENIQPNYSDDIFTLKIPYAQMTTELPNGEKFYAGIIITNSEVGLASASVAPVITTSRRYYIDNARDGVTAIRHIGEADPERVANGVEKALKAAQVGIAELVRAYHNPINNIHQELEIIQKKYDAIPNSAVLSIMDALADVPTISQLELANHLLEALQDLPLFQKLMAEKQVGSYLKLFSDVDIRMQAALEDMEAGN